MWEALLPVPPSDPECFPRGFAALVFLGYIAAARSRLYLAVWAEEPGRTPAWL